MSEALGHPLTRFSAATVYEAAGRQYALDPHIRPIVAGARVSGPAFTVQCAPGDNLAIHRALEAVALGDVIVIATGAPERSYLGAVLATAAHLRGAAAIVLDGLVRDVDELVALGFPVFARGSALIGAQKQEGGDFQVPVRCGGVAVNPGDAIVGDGDGVVAVPASALADVLSAAEQRDEWERAVRRGLAAGELIVDLLDLRAGAGGDGR